MATSSRRVAVWMSVMLTVVLLCVGATWVMGAQGQGSVRRLYNGQRNGVVFQAFPQQGDNPGRPSLDGAVAAMLYGKYLVGSDDYVGYLGYDQSSAKIEELNQLSPKWRNMVFLGTNPDKDAARIFLRYTVGTVSIYDHHAVKAEVAGWFQYRKDGSAALHQLNVDVKSAASMVLQKVGVYGCKVSDEETMMVQLATMAEMEGSPEADDIKEQLKTSLKVKFTEAEKLDVGGVLLAYTINGLEKRVEEKCPIFKEYSEVKGGDVGVECIYNAIEEVMGDKKAVDAFIVKRDAAKAQLKEFGRGSVMLHGKLRQVLYANVNILELSKVVFPLMEAELAERGADFYVVRGEENDAELRKFQKYSIRTRSKASDVEGEDEKGCLEFAKHMTTMCGAKHYGGHPFLAEFWGLGEEEFKNCLAIVY
eukprot:GHVS01030317.1.p1 GENE.GHVS01030317.1~~GHVS01030317.1.p1  ORF type:complete len:421 (+),score=58.93 GHVS01030317.1:155-1417(+)